MSVSYKPLFKLLIDKDIEKNQLVKNNILSRSTMLKMKKSEYISLEVLERICNYLNCNVQDIIEFVPDNTIN